MLTHERALARILAAVGVAGTAVACSSSVAKDDAQAGATSGAAQGGGGGAVSSGAVGGSTGEGGAGGKPFDPTGGRGGASVDPCGGKPFYVDRSIDTDACVPEPGEWDAYEKQVVCFSLPPSPDGCAALSAECVASTYACGLQDTADAFCGPLDTGSAACCYVLFGSCPVGRPFLVEGVARVAAAAGRTDWCTAERPETAALDAPTRATLAAYWTSEALTEHASIASFARFMLELLAVGAPAELVSGAQRALADEQEHARTAFALASAYAGAPVGPGPLAIDGAMGATIDRRSAALSTAREACIAETVSALLVADAAAAATDSVVRAALARIAEDELEHAALGWRVLAWLLADADAALRAEVGVVFASAARHVGFGTVIDAGAASASAAAAHGYQPLEQRRRVAQAALTAVIAPAAEALLALDRGLQAPRTASRDGAGPAGMLRA